jgi:beta propeller repeat protein
MRKILAGFIAFIMIITMFSSYASNSSGIMDDNITYADKRPWDDVASPGITDNEIKSIDKINISDKEQVERENDNDKENPENDNKNLPDNNLIIKKINRKEPDTNLKNRPMGTRSNGTETQITSHPTDQCFPAIYGDRIVWTDIRNSNYDIYMFDLSTSTETQITSHSAHQCNPAIYGDRIVWADTRNAIDGRWNIYMYNLSSKTETPISSEFSGLFPTIYGNKIVFSEVRNGISNIYLHDLGTNKETQITTGSTFYLYPGIYGNRIVWQDYRNGDYNSDIYMYDISTGRETQITTDSANQSYPAIYGNRIVWDDARNGNPDIYMYDLGTGTETQITTNPANQSYPAIYGSRIVWRDERNGFADIYMYDLSTNTEIRVTTTGSYISTFAPSIHRNRIVWSDYRNGNYDVFMYQYKTPPTINYLNVSKPFAYRSDVIEIYSNATDFEDFGCEVTPYFEYLAPEQAGWSNNLLASPIYLNEQWQSTFSIPINATLGYYDFRVRYNDTDDMWSNWFYLNGSLQVLNNPPRIDYFNLSKSKVITGEDLSILVNGTDIEDDPRKLLFKPEFKYSMSDFWDPLEFYEMGFDGTKFEFNFSMAADMEYGYYDFRVRTIDCDNDTSGWSYLNKSLLVNSAPPIMISIVLSKPEIYRTEQSEVYVNCTDFDSPREELTVELQYIPAAEGIWHDLSPDDMGDFWIDDLRTTKTSDLGIYNFRARATDWEDNSCRWFYLNDSFQVLNNLPKLIDITNIPEKMDRKCSLTITVNGSDKEDNEFVLYVELEYKLPGTHVWIVDYLSAPYYLDDCWRYEFSLPFDAPTGKYCFKARVQDLDKDWSTYLYLNDSLLVENQIPIVISFDQSPSQVYRTETVRVTSAGSDLETLNGKLECNMYFKSPIDVDWQKLEVNYNNNINKWDSKLITTISSTLGNYSFKVEFKDSEGLFSKPVYANRSVWVRNNLPVISDELDDIKIGSTQMILKLSDYGYDVETSKSNLKWLFDFSTVDTTLFHIDDENLDEQELTIYPAKSIEGQDDFTLILIDTDNGKAFKTDVTIVVNSKTGGKDQIPNQDNPIESIVGSSNVWLYILILIIIITFIIILIFYRRKKQKERGQKEEAEKVALEASITEPVQELPVAVDTATPALEGTAPEPVPAIEASKDPVPVPMPAEAPRPQLPEVTVQQPKEELQTEDEIQITGMEVEEVQPEEQSIPMAVEVKESEQTVETAPVQEEDKITKEEEPQKDKSEDENE